MSCVNYPEPCSYKGCDKPHNEHWWGPWAFCDEHDAELTKEYEEYCEAKEREEQGKTSTEQGEGLTVEVLSLLDS